MHIILYEEMQMTSTKATEYSIELDRCRIGELLMQYKSRTD